MRFIFKRQIKNLVAFGFNLVNRVESRKAALIRLYHNIGDDSLYLTVRPNAFEKQMRFLKDNGFNVVSLRALINQISIGQPIKEKTVVLTFDDGLLSHFIIVYPILEKYNFPATFFITTNKLGSFINNSENRPLPTINWEQLEIMSESPLVDIEPHGENHLELDLLSTREMEKEILESRRKIEERLRVKCCFFAPPRGKFNQETIKILRQNNFSAMLTVKTGLVDNRSDLFNLKRNTIDSTSSGRPSFFTFRP